MPAQVPLVASAPVKTLAGNGGKKGVSQNKESTQEDESH